MEIETCNTMCYNSNTVNLEDTSMATSTISVRTDAELKKEAEEIFKYLGINFSTAINIFLKKVVNTGGIPFEMRSEVPNKKTLKEMKIVQEYVESGGKKHKRHFTKYDSIEDLKKEFGIND